MNNKILVILYVPTIDKEYSIFIPIGKTVGAVKSYIVNAISEFTELTFTNEMNIYDKEKKCMYDDNALIKDTTMENGSQLVLI